MAPESPPCLLQIYRDFVKPGQESTFKSIEEDAARICAELRFPHAHLAIQSLTAPREVWWLNAFESEGDRRQVTEAYMANSAVVAALERIGKRRAPVIDTSIDVVATYRPDLGRGHSWALAGTRFFVVTVTTGDVPQDGPVFEAPDGTRFVMRPARTHDEASGLAAAATSETTLFAVRPYWGMPAKEWIAADPEFWSVNPEATAR